MLGELSAYYVFYTVAHYKNFSRAAEALFISQPAISKSVKSLESTLGLKLFVRESRGVSLTPEGKLLYTQLEKAFSALQDGEDLVHKLKNIEAGELRLGISTTLGTHFLIPLLSKFSQKYPKLQLHITNASTLDTLDLASKNLVDLAFVSSFTPLENLNFTPLASIHDTFVCSPAYYAQIKGLSTKELCSAAQFMLLSNKSVTRHFLSDYFSTHNLAITPHVEAGNMDFLIACAKADLGITSVVREFVTEELKNGSLVEVQIAKNIPPRSIGFAYSSKLPLSIASNCFVNYIKEHLKIPELK